MNSSYDCISGCSFNYRNMEIIYRYCCIKLISNFVFKMWCIVKTKTLNCHHIFKTMSFFSVFVQCVLFCDFYRSYSLETFSEGASYFFHVIFAFRAYNFSITSSHFSSQGIFFSTAFIIIPRVHRMILRFYFC